MLNTYRKPFEANPSMDFQDALRQVDQAITNVTERHLKDAEVTVLRGAWEGLTYEQMTTQSKFTVNYLRGDIGPKLWKNLTKAFGEDVTKTNIRAVLTRHQDLPPSPPQPLVRVPDLPEFYGRTTELQQLRCWLTQDKIRLVVLSGMAGIGKTSLAIKLVHQLQGKFETVLWRSLSTAPLLSNLITDILPPDSDILEKTPPSAQLALLLEYLRSHHCLVVLDNLEAILQAGSRYGEEYQDYGQLLGEVSEEVHRSCVLICTQEVPPPLQSLINTNPSVCALDVKGLKVEDLRELLQKKGLRGQEKWQDFLNDLEGHPLAVKIASGITEDLFDKDIAKFIKLRPTTLKELDVIFEEQVKRLSPIEKDILLYLAQQNQPLSIFEIKDKLSPSLSSSDLINGLLSLTGRSLIEKKFDQEREISVFSLHSLINSFVKKYCLNLSK